VEYIITLNPGIKFLQNAEWVYVIVVFMQIQAADGKLWK